MDEEKEEWVNRDEYSETESECTEIGKVRRWHVFNPIVPDAEAAEAKDRMIRSQMEHELASIMWDVRNRRGYDDPTNRPTH